jgi:hypothetical protein
MKDEGTMTNSPMYLFPTQHATVEWGAITAASLVEFHRQIKQYNIPCWGANCLVGLQELRSGKFRDVLIRTLGLLVAIPVRSIYPVCSFVQLTHHQCMYCPQINYPGTSGPCYK